MRFFRNVLGTLLTEVLIVLFNLLIGVLTARLLGPTRRGVLTLVMTLPVTLVALTDLGISQANIYFIARQKRRAAPVAANGVYLALGIGLLVGLGLWLARGVALGTVLRSMPARYFGFVLVLAPVLLLYTYWMAILRAFRRFALFNLLRLLMPASLLGMMLLALLVFHGGIGWATAAYGAGIVVAAGLSLAVVGAFVRPDLRPDWGLMKESLLYGFKSYLQNLVGHLIYRLDIYLVAFFLTPPEIAFYGIATSVAEMVWYIPNSVGLVLFPKLSAAEESEVHQLTAEVCRHTLLVTALAGVAVLAAGVVGIPLLYGAEYAPAVRPLILLVPGTTMMTLYKVLARNFSSRNRQQVSILAATVGLVLNGVLDWFLIPRLGMVGAALGSTLAYSAAGLVLLWSFRRESGLGLGDALRLRRSDLIRYRELVQSVRARLAAVGGG
ncbi:MAG TPA: hypothetical protein EYH30_11640 [Anaerolineales bacterium]|nr:hypothetical protein [Anaerolineales bacterium]